MCQKKEEQAYTHTAIGNKKKTKIQVSTRDWETKSCTVLDVARMSI